MKIEVSLVAQLLDLIAERREPVLFALLAGREIRQLVERALQPRPVSSRDHRIPLRHVDAVSRVTIERHSAAYAFAVGGRVGHLEHRVHQRPDRIFAAARSPSCACQNSACRCCT